ncbi:MAG: O-antigen ligase family protein, partial [Actinomycetia bacterium]|nr:O-antigen ligase family protein [Actinomycetes bacterium]
MDHVPFTGSTAREDGSYRRILSLWAAPVAGLVGLWVWLVFSSGGFIAHQWLPPCLVLGLFGLVVSSLVAYPRRPRQLSMAVLALFAFYGVWVAFSAIWADSVTRVWAESGRTFGYVLLTALALVYFTDPGARKAFRYLLLAVAATLLAVCIWRLWSTADIASLFTQNRLSYPVSYHNGSGALFLVGFWPLIWLASGPEERAPIRALALGLATGLFGLAIMTQSRGAIWGLGISLVFMFLVSPARLRMFLYLLVPALLLVYEFPALNRYWLEGPEAVGGALAARTLLVASVIAAFMGLILASLERWIRVSRRVNAVLGTVVLLAVLAGAVYGVVALTRDAGGPAQWVSQTWQRFTEPAADEPESSSRSRLTIVTSYGRVDLWRVAWGEFKADPVLGRGADNFVFRYDRLRTLENHQPQHTHSIQLQVLAETGLVGGVFFFGGVLLTLGGVLWPRCTAGRRGARATWLRRHKNPAASMSSEASPRRCNPRWGDDPRIYGWEMALLASAGYWFIHAGVDWLWQIPAVTIPVLLFVAAAVSSVDARAGVLWPRLGRWLRIGPSTPPAGTTGPATPDQVDPAAASPDALATVEDGGADDLPATPREPGRHTARADRHLRRAERRRQAAERLQPPGVLSAVFRVSLVILSLLVLVAAGLPYVSLQLQKSAKALAYSDGVRAVERAGIAHWFQPADPSPYLTQATIYENAALAAASSDSADRAAAVLDDLALSLDRLKEAIAH